MFCQNLVNPILMLSQKQATCTISDPTKKLSLIVSAVSTFILDTLSLVCGGRVGGRRIFSVLDLVLSARPFISKVNLPPNSCLNKEMSFCNNL